MDFGRDTDINEVDFTLTAINPHVKKVLGSNPSKLIKVYVGGVLWSDENFVGTIYPDKAKPKDYAKYYCKQFNTIELNTTHYRIPEKERIQKWQHEAPEGFMFCPKIPQVISHAGNLVSMVNFMNEFNELVKHFQQKLGLCFLQLPPHFAPNRLMELLEFLDRSELRNLAIEVRHPEWFTNEVTFNQLSNYLYKNKMPLVITDTAGRRDVLHMRFTAKSTVIRFNANNQHASDFKRMDEWIQHLKLLFEMGLENVYFFVHTPNQLHMPHLVTYFIHQLKRECGIHLTAPKIKDETGFTGELF
jgi:uncharacterized protein YecE (DUF72 family)